VIWDPSVACDGTVRADEAAFTVRTADTLMIAAAVRARSLILRDEVIRG
jgi:hypothetical protein